MRISSFKLQSGENSEGIKTSNRFKGEVKDLGNVVVITGANGSGKSRLLKLISKSFKNIKNEISSEMSFKIIKNGSDLEESLTPNIAKQFDIINYAHFDAKLQGPKNFSPYVISQAKNKLKNCDYEETALNSLLYLKDLCEGYSRISDESNGYKGLVEFVEFAKEFELDFSWEPKKKSLKISGRDFDNANLSPGQLYALRVAVACKAHEANENIAFLLDEPETHLHPSLLIKIVNQLMTHFKNAQFFISTHSLPLISYLTVISEGVKVLFMENGEIKDFLRSDSEPILQGMVGTEEEQFAIKQLLVSSEEMACNKFCMECFLAPTVVKGGVCGDPTVVVAENTISNTADNKPLVIVDYGAGDGRLLECMLKDNFCDKYIYNAYNIDKPAADYCEQLISQNKLKGKSYFGKESLDELNGQVDIVFMVNVLHEISPTLWKNEFDTICKLLKKDGKLVIIEREILTMGEAPFINGYLMLTGLDNRSHAAESLFGENNFVFSRDEKKPYIIAYKIEKLGVETSAKANMNEVLEHLEKNAIEQISRLRKERENLLEQKARYKKGMELAFWLNQLSCAIMCREDLDK